MITYSILERLSAAGYDEPRSRSEHILSPGTITSIKQGKPITTRTIDKLCKLLDCQPCDLITHVPD